MADKIIIKNLTTDDLSQAIANYILKQSGLRVRGDIQIVWGGVVVEENGRGKFDRLRCELTIPEKQIL